MQLHRTEFFSAICEGDGERQDEQKRPANEIHLTQFSLLGSEVSPQGGGSSGLRFASRDSRRNFTDAIANGRDEQKAKPTTLRLRVAGQIVQAAKEPKQ